MEQEKSGAVESSRMSTSFVSVAGRHRFSVELRPGETTIVSWKKLLKDVSKADRRSSVTDVPLNAHPTLDSHVAPVKIEAQPSDTGAEDPPPASRFSAVIEKIERLYMGKDSSDDEDHNDVADDDQYDTEDSFIDDAELDEYFQVDNSAIKHDGFFVNRGTLERIEAPLLPQKQPQKRRRKDLGNDDIDAPNKHVKLRKKASRKFDPMVEKNFGPAPVVALPSVHYDDVKFQNQMNASIIMRDKKKTSETRIVSDSSLPSKSLNDNASLSVPEEKDINKQKVGTQSLKHQKSFDKISNVQPNIQSGRSVNASDELDQSTHRRDNGVIHERVVVNASPGKSPLQTVNDQVIQRREGSSMRAKSTVLDKAIRELEKLVAESARPSGVEVQDADTSPAVKRRLPREVKLKLAKVARLAASHGKISKELVNRLMSIVGHLVQLRTLKRNLNIMVNMGLSAKKEKDDRFQQMKKEFREMVDSRVPNMKSKVIEQKTGSSNDFRAIANEEKVKENYNMDDILEDKMCDLYDLYVEGLDEDAGPLVRKLYVELARLWPDGFMDNRGIKHAIFRAKDRRKILYKRHKDHQEKIRRKKVLTPKTEGNVQSIAQTQHKHQDHVPTSVVRPLTDSTTDIPILRMASSSISGGGLDHRPRKDKVKVKGTNNPNETRVVKKRKVELAFGETNNESSSSSNLERPKSSSSHHSQISLHKSSITSSSSAPPPPLTNLE
ncbi:ubinuclein-1-like isoform X2 [Impatiens glandulifera]|uniref:ubinuclein-1-like isoform X2 n=1 Tax=Impatiens glandulifera TaxID=253017 RepID=UPI001FB13DE4|nr:ubinuclein-1-like isoform X2 [Impatiens glandulifera]